MKHRILLVEDDRTIAEEIQKYLQKWDFEVEMISDFSAVMEEFSAFSPHLVLMDVSLPFFNGYHWCTQIRQVSQIPIIFLSSAVRRRITIGCNSKLKSRLTPIRPRGLACNCTFLSA